MIRAMNTQLVMTIIGPDQPGLVEAVSRVVSVHGGNWLESRMAHLAGQFAGILRVEVPLGRADALTDALTDLENSGLKVVIQRSHDDGPDTPFRRIQLELAGSDHPGIVQHITEVLASHGVNIEELSTEVTSAPMAGTPMFVAGAVLQVPTSLKLDELTKALEAVAADVMVDLTLRESTEQDDDQPGSRTAD